MSERSPAPHPTDTQATERYTAYTEAFQAREAAEAERENADYLYLNPDKIAAFEKDAEEDRLRRLIDADQHLRASEKRLAETEADGRSDYLDNGDAYHERALEEDRVRTEVKQRLAGVAINVFQVRDAGHTLMVRTPNHSA